MNKEVRRKLDAATAALDFVRANPSDDPAFVKLGQDLEAGIGRLTDIAEAQSVAAKATTEANATFDRVRKDAQRGVLRMIAKAGAVVPRGDDKQGSPFRTALWKLSKRGFLNEARALLDTAARHAEAIAPRGATPEVVAEAGNLVDTIAATLDTAIHARNERFQATSTLREARSDMSDLLARLDAYLQFRYAGTPELLNAWRRARNVGRRRAQSGSAEPAGDGSGPETPVTPINPAPESTGTSGEHAA